MIRDEGLLDWTFKHGYECPEHPGHHYARLKELGVPIFD